MFSALKTFFKFCDKENRNKLIKSIIVSLFFAIFEAMKIPAIAVILQAILLGEITNKAVITCLVIMIVSILGQGLLKYIATMLQTEAGYTCAANKRMEIAEHLRYLPMGYFNKNSLGYITSVATNSMESLSDIATKVVMMVTNGVLGTLVITLMLLFFDPRISLIMAIGIIIFYLANVGLQHKSEKIAPRKNKSDYRLVEDVLEYIQGISEVKSYHLVGNMSKKLNDSINENVNVNTKMEVDMVPWMTLQNLISKLIGVAVSIFSIVFYCNGTMSLLNTIVMLICAFMLTVILESAGSFSALLRVIDLVVNKAQDILDIPEMDISGKDITPENHNITAENIEFSYDKKKIINGISLNIPEKTTTAIVGPSGGGKTTLCNLISRFWDVDKGRVTLGGHDVKEYSMDSLMKNFSFVFQNVTLFRDTIANNIRFCQPDAPMDKVIEASKKARCHDFIMSLPDGYETIIGEDGGTLSGGERQRLSIARAIMKDSPIIILDEATSNIDPENEKELMEAIGELTKDKTIIMIAHRLKTIQHADQILVVDKGQIVQQGNHSSLMKEEGIYKDFVQVRKQAASWKI